MANRTVKDAQSVKGTNPQHLVEKIIRSRVYDCKYWKEECFALTAELLVDKAMVLDHIGGVYGGNVKPTDFVCLILKMLQIQPSKDIVIEFIKNPDYKYVRALGAMYLRLIGTSLECYNYLEPLYNDYRKIRMKNKLGVMELLHMDEFVDQLLTLERVCDVILPRIQKRHILEQLEQLEPRVSALEEDLSDVESEEEDEEEDKKSRPRSHSPDRERGGRRSSSPRSKRRSRSPRDSRSPSPSHRRKRKSSRSPTPDRHHRRSRSRSLSPTSKRQQRHGRKHSRSRSRSRSYSPHHSRHHSDKRERDTERRDRDTSDKKEKSSSDRRDRNASDRKEKDEGKKDKDRSDRKNKDAKKEKDDKKDKEVTSKKDKKDSSDKDNSDKKEKTKEKKKKAKPKDEATAEEEEIRQANELRAKLGLKPLKRD